MDKQILAYSYYGILLTNKKQWITDTHNNIDKCQNKYAEWKKTRPKKSKVYDSIYTKC